MTDDLAGTVRERTADLFQALDVGHMGMALKRWAGLLDILIEVRLDMSIGAIDAAKTLVGGPSGLDERVAALENRLDVTLRGSNKLHVTVPKDWYHAVAFGYRRIRQAMGAKNYSKVWTICDEMLDNHLQEVNGGDD
jgi:hypothetical protein